MTQVGREIETWARPSDSLARLGGDAFAILLTRLSDDAAAERMARQLLGRLRSGSFNVGGFDLSVDASIGIAPIPPLGANADNLLRRADVAMYQAKRTGGGVVVYDEADDPSDLSPLALLVRAPGRDRSR